MDEKDLAQGAARADFFRFLAACYYEPGPAFAEEGLFGSMATVAPLFDASLGKAAVRLGEAFEADSLENLLVDYTRLFLGPIEAPARPYGSVWMDRQPGVMRDSTMEVLALYEEGGFEIDEGFRELPDHVAAELELLYLLLFRENAARRAGDEPGLAKDAALRRRLLSEHLGRWVGPFSAAVRDGAKTAFYRELGLLTERAVAVEARRAAEG